MLRLFLGGFLWLIGLYGLGYRVDRTVTAEVLGWYALAFAGYALLVFFASREDRRMLGWGLAAVAASRLLLLPSLPLLSDDVYRFLWDGRLLAAGLDPFAHTPRYYMEGAGQTLHIPGIDEALYRQLNSPRYHTVYPPVAQFFFWLSGLLFPQSTLGGTLVLRAGLLLFDGLALYTLLRLLPRWGMASRRAFGLLLHPLWVVEGLGNLHFELAASACLLAALDLWKTSVDEGQGRSRRSLASWLGGAVAYAGAVAAKLNPLLLGPFLVRRMGWGRSLATVALALALTAWGFAAVLDAATLPHLFESLSLYFQRFEFNASVYYLLRWLGFAYKGYNLIALWGKGLAAATVLGLLWLAWREGRRGCFRELPQIWTYAWTLYLLLSTTVHPWYWMPALALAPLAGLRHGWAAAAAATLSYHAYHPGGVAESGWILALEYGLILGVLVIDLRSRSAGRLAGSAARGAAGM